MKLTLNDLREAAEEQFGRLTLEVAEGRSVAFLNPVQMSVEQRERMKEAGKALEVAGKKGKEKGDEDLAATLAAVKNVVRVMLADEADMAVLEEVLGEAGDLWITLMTSTWKALKAGEA